MALAIPIRWICPPDSLAPLSPTKVSRPSGKFVIKFSSCANLMALFKFFFVSSLFLLPRLYFP